MAADHANNKLDDPYHLAVQKARSERIPAPEPRAIPASPAVVSPHGAQRTIDAVSLNRATLLENRLVSFQERTPMTAAFDLLRTRLLMFLRERNWRTVIVTSPTPQCGKTVTAINLAMSLSRQKDATTMLVDFDLRKPSVNRYLGVQRSRDIHDLLSGRATLTETLYTTDVLGPSLRVLGVNSPVPQPAEVLGSNAMVTLVEELRSSTPDGIIIFDMPPLLGADDVLAFLPNADGILLVAASGQSRTQELVHSEALIPEHKLIGTVFSKSMEPAKQYYHYY